MEEKTLTIEDLLCMLDEIEPGQGRRGYELLVATFRQGQYAKLYAQIEQMAEDAGTDRNKVGWEREAFLLNQHLDYLLGLDPDRRVLELAAGIGMVADDYETLLRICTTRRVRGEGDIAELTALEHHLTAILQDKRAPKISAAQESLDLAIEQLVRAYTERVGAKLAHQKTTQYLLARVCRELLGIENLAQFNMAG